MSTIPSIPATTALLHALEHDHYRGLIPVTALHERDAALCQSLGVDFILRPFTIAAEATCQPLGLPVGTDAPASRGTALP